MQIDKATVEDVENLTFFFREAWEESTPRHFGFAGATEETINEIASEDFLKKRLSNPDVAIYIVKDGEKSRGFAATRKIDRDSIELSGIIMIASETGKGFGSQLIEKAIASARGAGFHKMVVKTESQNKPAIVFYKKRGFT